MTVCTIAIPVYNRTPLTRRALESALAQTADGLEILAVDDASTDDVWEALRSYPDPRLRTVRNPVNLGLFGNFNRCLELAAGRYVRILCCDDVLAPGCLGREIAVMEANPTVALLSTRGRLVNGRGEQLGRFADGLAPGWYRGGRAVLAALWLHSRYGYNPFNYPSGVLLRRDHALLAGSFPTTMRVAGDVDLFLRLLETGDLAVVDHVGCDILCHEGQVGHAMRADGWELREFLAIARHHRARLEEAGHYRGVVAHLAGLALGMALNFRRLGCLDASRAYDQVARETGIPRTTALLALSETLALRALVKVTGFVCRPIHPTGRLLAQPAPGPPVSGGNGGLPGSGSVR